MNPMRRQRGLSLLLVLSLAFLAIPAQAQTTNWVSSYSVHDFTGNVDIPSGSPLLAGHNYNVTLTLSVPFTQQLANFYVSLDPSMTLTGSQYWYVLTSGYAGYSPGSFTPGSPIVNFTQVQGTVILSAIFTIPATFTTHVLNNSEGVPIEVRFANPAFDLITAFVTGGSRVGNFSLTISDDAIQTYLNTYSQKSTLISSGKIDPAYTTVINALLSQAQNIFTSGLPVRATALLNTLTTDNFPAPPSTTVSTLLVVSTVVLALVAVLLALMWVRTRSKHGFAGSIVSDAQKELASLEVTAGKYDKALAERLRKLKEQLGDAL
jgi:hypothetical protein